MSRICDPETIKWLLRLILAVLTFFVSFAGCCVVLVGLGLEIIFRMYEFPKRITRLGLRLMETPLYVMNSCYNDQERAALGSSPITEVRNHIFEKLTPQTPPPSFETNKSSGHSDSCNVSVQVSSLKSHTGFAHCNFTYEELSAATNNFSKENILGEGGFGCVYKGKLPDGREVAIKMLKGNKGLPAELDEFQAEAAVISQVHHRHLVGLVGCAIGHDKVMLVFEFVANKTLQFHLHESKDLMEWPTRLKVAIGSAKGLAYLHEECKPRIIHRDVKAANILLDHSFEPKVGDFGLARYINDENTHVSTRVMGTIGYLAPEYASTGQLTDKSDVFSFGVMLVELISGRKPIMRNDTTHMARSLVDWARPLVAHAATDGNYDSLVDPRLENKYNLEELKRMVACAGACIHFFPDKRPHMIEVLRLLEGVVSPDSYLNAIVQFNQTPVSVILAHCSDPDSSSQEP
ncbi:Proline-rich receptor-like protein kinase PERK4 [Rhynchospora pubera]|uniref:non-specific serine/threonine protein kinase n=1 Tax=Rhynchospora pubera TaxID=906938 RepID=A0AAV8DCL0_9POAL|nr:Proline-rich receptor-like protein kinase PERK4 [Rhynchospora pubera]KAJ4818346.1 Proline-rich receptor-like protein kinase PERK4 [Rhynchospora pubera]